ELFGVDRAPTAHGKQLQLLRAIDDRQVPALLVAGEATAGPREFPDEVSRVRVVDEDVLLQTGTDDEATRVGEASRHPAAVPGEGAQQRAGLGVPQPCRAVVPARQNVPATGRIADALDRLLVSLQTHPPAAPAVEVMPVPAAQLFGTFLKRFAGPADLSHVDELLGAADAAGV